MKISISTIEMDVSTQPRAELDSNLIAEYAELMKSGVKMPSVALYKHNGHLWLADGWHRVLAAKSIGLEDIDADVQNGDKRQAILHAVGANADHGARRQNKDKRRAVMTLLNDSEWKKWSDREIARRCRVDNSFVSDLRRSLLLTNSDDARRIEPMEPPTRTYTDKHGNISQMNIKNIGKEVSIAGKPKFNRTNENIGWAAWSWNPVTGCKGGCIYCYARDIAMRFEGHFKPALHEDRLDAPANTNPLTDVDGGHRVFVCSMADLFGSWIPNEWIASVIKSVETNPQWTFLFLTKNPQRYESIVFPSNAWIGATVDKQERVKETERAMERANADFKFVSCEPLLEKVVFKKPEIFDAFIIGSQSASSKAPAFQPEWKWVMSLLRQIDDAGKLLWWKDNLFRPQQLPKR